MYVSIWERVCVYIIYTHACTHAHTHTHTHKLQALVYDIFWRKVPESDARSVTHTHADCVCESLRLIILTNITKIPPTPALPHPSLCLLSSKSTRVITGLTSHWPIIIKMQIGIMLKVQQNWVNGSKEIWESDVSFGHNCNYNYTFPASPCSIANETNRPSEQNGKLSTITKGLESVGAWKTSHKHNKDLNQLQ